MIAAKTEEELAKCHWWWKRTRFLFPRNSIDPNLFEFQEWEDGLEQTAFEYELVRRVCKTNKLPPFVELDGWMQECLHHRLCPPRKKFTQVMSATSAWFSPPGEKPIRIDKGDLVPNGLSEADSDNWRLNLEVTNNQLLENLRIRKLPSEAELNSFLAGHIDEKQFQEILEAKKAASPSKAQFLADINRQQTAQSIVPPRGLQGQRNRAVSWRWIELLDIAEFKVQQRHTQASKDVERQTRRRARVMARRLLPKCLEALEEFENSCYRPKEKVRPKPLLARELKTN